MFKMPGRYLKILLLLMVNVENVVPQNIVENSGRSVLLPCLSQLSESVVWKKLPNTVILIYESGKSDVMPGYAGRAQLNEKEIPQGNLSLVLSNIQKSDEGRYSCYTSEKSQEISLIVTDPVTSVTEKSKASGRESGNTGVKLIPQKFLTLLVLAAFLFLYG